MSPPLEPIRNAAVPLMQRFFLDDVAVVFTQKGIQLRKVKANDENFTHVSPPVRP
jgi:hypothetical protein